MMRASSACASRFVPLKERYLVMRRPVSGSRVGVHTLRHCFATHLLEQKTDIRVIQVLLGHKKLDTTALYTRVAISTIGQVTSPLDFLRKMPG
jgi:site-specific recombinase XerD